VLVKRIKFSEGDFLKAVKKNIVLNKTLQIMAVALITGLLFYYAVTRILIFDMENSLIRFAKQGAATVSSFVQGRLSETRSIAANSIISNTSLPIEMRLEELRKQLHLDKYRRLSIADMGTRRDTEKILDGPNDRMSTCPDATSTSMYLATECRFSPTALDISMIVMPLRLSPSASMIVESSFRFAFTLPRLARSPGRCAPSVYLSYTLTVSYK
jgi:hypothetical protein